MQTHRLNVSGWEAFGSIMSTHQSPLSPSSTCCLLLNGWRDDETAALLKSPIQTVFKMVLSFASRTTGQQTLISIIVLQHGEDSSGRHDNSAAHEPVVPERSAGCLIPLAEKRVCVSAGAQTLLMAKSFTAVLTTGRRIGSQHTSIYLFLAALAHGGDATTAARWWTAVAEGSLPLR